MESLEVVSGVVRHFNSDDSLNQIPVPTGFDLVERVHSGNVNDIWKISDRQTGQLFALKCLNPEASNCSEKRQQFRREIETAHSIRGKFVCRAEDSGRIRLLPYLIMEWLDGTPIANRLHSNEYLSIGQSIWSIRQGATGLQEMGAAGYSHGNVSLDHLLVNSRGEVKLIDWSSALPVDDVSGGVFSHENGHDSAESVTRFKSFNHSDAVSYDMFCLGAAWREMLIGESFWPPNNDAHDMDCVSAEQLMGRRPTIPSNVAELVAQMLSPQPLLRPQSFMELTRHLIEIELHYLPIQHRVDSSRGLQGMNYTSTQCELSSDTSLSKAG